MPVSTPILEGTPEQLNALLGQLTAHKRYRIVEAEDYNEPTPEAIAAADARLLRHSVRLSHAHGLNNEDIDADLVRAYDADNAADSRGA